MVGQVWNPGGTQWWKSDPERFQRLSIAGRLLPSGKTLRFKRYLDDYAAFPRTLLWEDTAGGVGGDKLYVVQTGTNVIQRCLLMTTDPGDLVLDPTCGSGTTAFVAEQWGRRWITIDTSRVALARARIMGAKFPFYLLADSPDGRRKEAESPALRRLTPPPVTTSARALSMSASPTSR
jgi:adenine-specific DNA-methyltransferase